MMGLEVFIISDHLSFDRSPLEACTEVKKKNNVIGSPFQGKVGFRYIMETNWKSTSAFPSFFLPCQRWARHVGFR